MTSLDDFLDKGIYVIDTETTGLDGYPKDVVVDIAVCRADVDRGTVDRVYSSIVGHDVDGWNDGRRNAWIFQNTDLTLDMVASAPPEADVASDIRRLLDGKDVTSFNTGFDLDRFLYKEPWSLGGTVRRRRCIMLASKDVCKLPGIYEEYKWPKLEEAYSMITEGDPADIRGRQTHRAMSDAVMASYILIRLCSSGRY